MSDPVRVLLLGAGGLVGSQILARLRDVPQVRLVGIARREVALPRGCPVEMLVADPANWHRAIAMIAPDAVICALGTTQAKAGREGLAAVDRDLVHAAALASREAGARQFTLASSVGADVGARAYYLRIKGEAEEACRKLRFDRLDILRPGLLRGPRAEMRPAEALAKIASPLTDALLWGELRRYRSIRAGIVADAALRAVQERSRGAFVHEHDALLRLGARLGRPE